MNALPLIISAIGNRFSNQNEYNTSVNLRFQGISNIFTIENSIRDGTLLQHFFLRFLRFIAADAATFRNMNLCFSYDSYEFYRTCCLSDQSSSDFLKMECTMTYLIQHSVGMIYKKKIFWEGWNLNVLIFYTIVIK